MWSDRFGLCGLSYREKGGEICVVLSPGNIPIHRIVESLRMEKMPKVIESNH